MVEFVNDTIRYVDSEGITREAVVAVVAPLQSLLTNEGGDNSRIRVDVAQTGFFDGREFRTFLRKVSMSEPLTIRAVVPINIILFGLGIDVSGGHLLVETIVGATESGTFDSPLPVFNRNNMTTAPSYSPAVSLTSGGSVSGGTVLDILESKVSDNSNFSSSVGSSTGDERGILPGTYHFRLTPIQVSSFVMKARWEERP